MAGYDPRVASAFAALGYDIFPFQSFDMSGNPLVPGNVTIPDHYKATLQRIASSPVWLEIFKAVSVLDDPAWDAYMAALAFVGNDVRVSVFKSMATVDGPQSAHEWATSFHTTVENTISEYAGRSYLVDPAWVAILNKIIGELPPSQKANDPKAGGATDPGGKTPGGGQEVPLLLTEAGGGVEGLVPPWLLLGLRVMTSVLTSVTVRTYVRSTVFWFPGGQPPVDRAHAQAWKPLHMHYEDGRRRSVHGIWNWNWASEPEHIGIWSGPEFPWRGAGVGDMPHEPWQWCRAFFPTGNCGGPSIVETEDAPYSAAV